MRAYPARFCCELDEDDGRIKSGHDEPPWVLSMSDLIRIFSERGDLGHLALFLWASAGLLFTLRELSAASRRFDDFDE